MKLSENARALIREAMAAAPRGDRTQTARALATRHGVSEATNLQGEEFGTHRLRSLFSGAPPISAQEANAAVLKAVAEFAGDQAQSDDITCLALHRSMTA